MKSYVVIGLGRFGSAVAQELMRIGSEVLAIDSDEERVNGVAPFVTHALIGDATDEAVLRSIGVQDFDCVIVAIGENLEHSVLITLALKDLGARKIVCKARDDTYKRVLEKVGADRVVVPERDMGRRLAQTLNNSNILDYIELSNTFGLVEMTAPRVWVGQSLLESHIRERFGITVLAAHDPDGSNFVISPPAGYVVKENDVLIVVGRSEDFEKVQKL